MSKKQLHRSLTLLALPSVLIAGCSETVDSEDSVNERASLTQLEIVGADQPYLLHPIKVAVAAEVDSEEFSTDLVVGLRSEDQSVGCVLGAMPIEHPQAGAETFEAEAEFLVNGTCAALVDRDDVELFAAFDPWDRLGDGQGGAASSDENLDLYTIVEAASLDQSACETCEETLMVQPSPGRDAQLREVHLSSVVAVLPVPMDGQAAQAEGLGTPDFSVSSTMRVTGLDKGQGVPEGVSMTHRIRPLGSNDEGLTLTREAVEVSGPQEINNIFALYIEGAARESMIGGAWSNIEEFELVTCVATDFAQAEYPEAGAAEANDCAAIPVVVVREQLGADGLPLPQPGAASVRSAESWGDDWGWNNSTFGYSGVSLDVWLDVNGSETATQTYGGIDVLGAGSWFEAGVKSIGTVFDHSIDIVDIYATFIAYDAGGGGAAMGASIFWTDFIPDFEIQLSDGVEVSLQDMFDLAGVDVDPSISAEYPIVGVKFDDGCGNVTAAMTAVGTIGIDTEATTIEASSTPQGAEVTGTITPYLNMAAVAETSVSYSEYLSGGVVVTLNLLNISVPFTVSAELMWGNAGVNKLIFNEFAQAVLTVLSGDISYYIKYKIPWPLCWSSCKKTHSGTLLDWNGYSPDPLTLFSATQTVSWNAAASVCGNEVCEWDEGSSCAADCGPSWMYADRVNIDEEWTHVQFPYVFSNPVVIAGPASQNGSDPGVVRIRNVDSEGFDIRFQEYAYLDGTHAIEQVAWMVAEAGTHTAPDGTTWEVGTTTAGGDVDNLTTTAFSGSYTTAPLLLATPQTSAGSDAPSLRADNVNASTFDLFLDEEEAKTDGHMTETVGYIAIAGTPSNWTGNGYTMYSSTSNSVDENWVNFSSFQLRVQEEQSNDTETSHNAERLNVLGMTGPGSSDELVFALDVTNNGADTCAIRWR